MVGDGNSKKQSLWDRLILEGLRRFLDSRSKTTKDSGEVVMGTLEEGREESATGVSAVTIASSSMLETVHHQGESLRLAMERIGRVRRVTPAAEINTDNKNVGKWVENVHNNDSNMQQRS